MSDRQIDVLASIDGALDDWTEGDDAMRWQPPGSTELTSGWSIKMCTEEEYAEAAGHPPDLPPNVTIQVSGPGGSGDATYRQWVHPDYVDPEGGLTFTIQGRYESDTEPTPPTDARSTT